MTGHASGLITLNVEEADDAKRERMVDGVATLDQVIAKLQSRAAGRDSSRAGMAAFVAQ